MSIKRKGSESANALEMKSLVFELGKKLNIVPDTEISDKPTNIKIEKEYRPEVDGVWYLNTCNIIKNSAKLSFLEKKVPIKYLKHFPLIGFEIEASDPTSKTQMSNINNYMFMKFHLYQSRILSCKVSFYFEDFLENFNFF